MHFALPEAVSAPEDFGLTFAKPAALPPPPPPPAEQENHLGGNRPGGAPSSLFKKPKAAGPVFSFEPLAGSSSASSMTSSLGGASRVKINDPAKKGPAAVARASTSRRLSTTKRASNRRLSSIAAHVSRTQMRRQTIDVRADTIKERV